MEPEAYPFPDAWIPMVDACLQMGITASTLLERQRRGFTRLRRTVDGAIYVHPDDVERIGPRYDLRGLTGKRKTIALHTSRGWRAVDIARLAGVSLGYVYKVQRQLPLLPGSPPRQDQRNKGRAIEVAALFDDGWSGPEIADYLGVSHQWVYQIRKRLDQSDP